mmetsp:Transcript_73997/g.123580  ORF Transcript_73997/g.123580 Transcript_73997/m.123580 type:complete len:298 (+) Transcript_73997:88-981(+)
MMLEHTIPTSEDAYALLRELRNTINPQTNKPFQAKNARVDLNFIRAALAVRRGLAVLSHGKFCYQKAAKMFVPPDKIHRNSGRLVKQWCKQMQLLELVREEEQSALEAAVQHHSADDLLDMVIEEYHSISAPSSSPAPPSVPSLPPSAPSATGPLSSKPVLNTDINYTSILCIYLVAVIGMYVLFAIVFRSSFEAHKMLLHTNTIARFIVDNQSIPCGVLHTSCLFLHSVPDSFWLFHLLWLFLLAGSTILLVPCFRTCGDHVSANQIQQKTFVPTRRRFERRDYSATFTDSAQIKA